MKRVTKKKSAPRKPISKAKPRAKKSSGRVEELLAGVRAGDKKVLAQAITLIESNAAQHSHDQSELVKALLPLNNRSLRIGISGVPGAGKSSLINRLGTLCCQQGHKVAVLAVDPTSPVSGGSILGDKTRMEDLSREPQAFIRPSPSKGTSGGVHNRSREVMLLCEAAGFDVILVETVGVGQSEVAVRSMVDLFVLVSLTGAGDELQSMKRGILELADVVLINKADAENTQPAKVLATELLHALRLFHGKVGEDKVPVVPVSALTGEGIELAWQQISALEKRVDKVKLRSHQAVEWFEKLVQQGIVQRLGKTKAEAARLSKIRSEVAQGKQSPLHAAEKVLATLK